MTSFVLVFFLACDSPERTDNKDVVTEKEDKTSNQSNPLNNEECDFDCFKELFKNRVQDLQFNELKDEYSLPSFLNKIPDELVKKHFNLIIRTGYHVGVFSKEIVVQEDNYIGFKYMIPCLGGGSCSDTYLSTVSNQGNHISSLRIEGDHSDLVNQLKITTVYLNRDGIKMKFHEKGLSDNGKDQIDTVYFKNYTIDKYGHVNPQ